MSGTKGMKWSCFQLGSREHYAIPRALHRQGRLDCMFTDSWIPKAIAPALAMVNKSLSLRRHEEIPGRMVKAATFSRIMFDLQSRMKGLRGWTEIVARNDWVQAWLAQEISAGALQGSDVFFSYSYTARLPFKRAKQQGLTCVLGQIDPGPLENDLVDDYTWADRTLAIGDSNRPPENYWDDWREEIELADVILVNSEWSANLLIQAGAAAEKLRIVPLAYEGQEKGSEYAPGRPGEETIKVLFLGQLILRKGVGVLFEAIKRLKGRPFEFIFAGPISVTIPEPIKQLSNVKMLGVVDRVTAGQLYRESDVLILPTYSDGFAITQLEAQANHLPVIASANCGRVVIDGVNGLLLPEIKAEAICAALERLAGDRELLREMKINSWVRKEFSLENLAENLVNLKF